MIEPFILKEGVYDPGIFKAFFLAGGPGSGKTYVTQRVMGGLGLKNVNSDRAFEVALKKNNMSLKMPDSEAEKRDQLRKRAKELTTKNLENYIAGRLGLVVDSTGRDYDAIASSVSLLKQMGYDCYMIFVNTSLDVALERNKIRSRSIPEYIVQKSWEGVQSNIGSFQRIFSPNKMLVIDNNRSEQELITQTLNQAARFIRSKLTTKPENGVALNWIKKELEAKKRI